MCLSHQRNKNLYFLQDFSTRSLEESEEDRSEHDGFLLEMKTKWEQRSVVFQFTFIRTLK